MKKTLLLAVSLFAFALPFYSQSKINLSITPEDVYIIPGDENGASSNVKGFHLFIRKKAGLESVMLVESSTDPNGKLANYAFRATEYNKINGNEIRYLNGKVLDSEYAKYSLIDSTPESDKKFGQSFHIYIPETIVYGYPWTRNGTVNIENGFKLNIRGFSKKYCDYTGSYCDNSFNLNVKKSKSAKAETKKQAALPEKVESVKLPEVIEEDFPEPETFVFYDEDDVDVVSPVPFEEEELLEPESEDSEEPSDEMDADETEEDFLNEPFAEEELAPEDLPPLENEMEEEGQEEAEWEEIPDEDKDIVSPEPFIESQAQYDPHKLEKTKRVFDDWVEQSKLAVPDDPYAESMDGVDPDFIAKIEAEKQARLALENAQNSEEEEEIIQVYGDRYKTFDIEMLLVRGSKKIPDLYISTTEVTQKSYKKITGQNPSTNAGEDNPVETVSYYDVMAFCNTLSMRVGKTPCYSLDGETNPKRWGLVPLEDDEAWNSIECDFDADGYRMLTIEEWTYAANGGLYKEKGDFAGSKNIEAVAWYADNSDESTHTVGMKSQNPCGLFDMCGNVSEYVMGKSGNSKRTAAVRGGNYTYESKFCKTKFKDSCQPWYAHFENGIRICCKADVEEIDFSNDITETAETQSE